MSEQGTEPYARIATLEVQLAALVDALLGTAQFEDTPDGPCWCSDAAWGDEPPNHSAACLDAKAALASAQAPSLKEKPGKAEARGKTK